LSNWERLLEKRGKIREEVPTLKLGTENIKIANLDKGLVVFF
jgi:hypothetical protein